MVRLSCDRLEGLQPVGCRRQDCSPYYRAMASRGRSCLSTWVGLQVRHDVRYSVSLCVASRGSATWMHMKVERI